tara:strand:- start:3862 stop:4929 length:1068 start_codon:yes stop_codon:yes gene_type:complete
MANQATNQLTTIGDLVASTLQNSSSKLVDNIFKKSWYLSKLQGMKETEEGGSQINRSIEYGTNGTFQSYYGYDAVPIVPQETVTDTQWTWKELQANWVVSRRELRQNSGKAKIRSLIDQKKKSMERSFREGMNAQLLNPANFLVVGNSGKDLTPLSTLVSISSSLTVGGISESSSAYWANQRRPSASTDTTALAGSAFVNECRSFSNTCGQNSDGFPNLGVWGKRMYETYVAILDQKVRYSSTDSATNGFRSVMCENMEVYWDQIVPRVTTGTTTLVPYTVSAGEDVGYFLNTDFLYLIVDSGTDFVMTPAVTHDAQGQQATSGAMLFMGEHVCTNRRAQGVLYGVSTPDITLTN